MKNKTGKDIPIGQFNRITEVQTQYVYTTEEIINMLKDAGFSNIEIFDDYYEVKYTDRSLRAVFTAVKG